MNQKLTEIIAVSCLCAALILISILGPNSFPQEIRIENTIYRQSGINIKELPAGSFKIGILEGILHRTKLHPQESFHGTNLDEKYAGCPIYASSVNYINIIYLEDFSGFYIPFIADESSLVRSIPFDFQYRVQDTVFQDVRISSFDRYGDTQPFYFPSADGEFYIMEDRKNRILLYAGEMYEIELTEDNFDKYMKTINSLSGWMQDITIEEFRKTIVNAWRVDVVNDKQGPFYVIFMDNKEEVYLGIGTHEQDKSEEDTSYFHKIVKLIDLENDPRVQAKVLNNGRIALIYNGNAYLNPFMPTDELPADYEFSGYVNTKNVHNASDMNGLSYFMHRYKKDCIYVYQPCGTPIGNNTIDTEKIQWAYMPWVREDSGLTVQDVLP